MKTPEEMRAYKAAWRREKYASDSTFREKEKQNSRKQSASRTQKDWDNLYAARRERYAEDETYREKAKANARLQYEKQSPEKRRAKQQEWRKKNREKVRKKSKEEAARLREEILNAYGPRCACCGTAYKPHLTLDHINGGGTKERQEAKGSSIFRRLRREEFPAGYRVLCWNCNWAEHRGGCRCQSQG